jgi:hypothetical protein
VLFKLLRVLHFKQHHKPDHLDCQLRFIFCELHSGAEWRIIG